jgi:CO/xanthine dehydrogenase FAD-binding subunit
VAEAVDPPEDLHATAAYRRALAATLTERALKSASAMQLDSQHG